MKRALFVTAIGFALVMAVAAQTATVTGFSGKVEYRLGSAAWQSVRVGLVFPLNATISTGFGARATLSVGTSTIQVAQLTRLTVEELADDGSTVSTGIFVPVGRVRASIATSPTRSTRPTLETARPRPATSP